MSGYLKSSAPAEPSQSPAHDLGRCNIQCGVNLAANRDILAGYRFCATMQIRTPLRVLKHHGELHSDVDKPPPWVAAEPWEGIWVPVTRSWRELGIDVDEPPSTMASDVGPIAADGGDYLKFLLELRAAAEGDGRLDQRREAAAECVSDSRWGHFVAALGGAEGILSRLFPPFLSIVPRLSTRTTSALAKAGFDTPGTIATASEQALRAVPGIGPGTVRALRQAASEAADPHSQFVDRVKR